jgi:hypothetical protein
MPSAVAIRPQPKQAAVLACESDIAIMGGAGGGKTYALLLEPLYHQHIHGFMAVTFRRTHPMLTAEGGIWDTSYQVYPFPPLKGHPRLGDLSWQFPSGATHRFAHLQYEQDVQTWYSAQIALLQFDQLEQFTRNQFFEMLTRNRWTCGVRPYCRASCNPDPDSFLVDFLAWWIGEDGYALPEWAGQTRWFLRLPSDELAWDDSAEALTAVYGHDVPSLSVTFFPMFLEDNPALTLKDPNYRAKLMAQPQYMRDACWGATGRPGRPRAPFSSGTGSPSWTACPPAAARCAFGTWRRPSRARPAPTRTTPWAAWRRWTRRAFLPMPTCAATG